MKRVLLTVALCVAASVSFAQKKAVNEAQSIAKGSTPVSYTHLTLPTKQRV